MKRFLLCTLIIIGSTINAMESPFKRTSTGKDRKKKKKKKKLSKNKIWLANQLIRAIDENDVKSVEKALESGANPHAFPKGIGDSLTWCTPQMVSEVSLHHILWERPTPLEYAFKKEELIKILMRYGARYKIDSCSISRAYRNNNDIQLSYILSTKEGIICAINFLESGRPAMPIVYERILKRLEIIKEYIDKYNAPTTSFKTLLLCLYRMKKNNQITPAQVLPIKERLKAIHDAQSLAERQELYDIHKKRHGKLQKAYDELQEELREELSV